MSTFSIPLSVTGKRQLAPCNFLGSTRIVFALSFVLLCFYVFAPPAHSAAITLAWDPNSPSENIAGYRLYYGTESRNYSSVIDITNGTLKKVNRLAKGNQYYFAVTAYNGAGQESDFSEELVVNTCTYKLSPRKKTFKPEGGVATVKVTTQPACPWTASTESEWLEIMDGEDGLGPGVITFLVEPNSTPETRMATSSFAGKTFFAKQKGATIP